MDLGKALVLTHPARMGDSLMALPLTRALSGLTSTDSNVGQEYRFFFDLAGIEVGYAGPLYPKGFRALLSEAKALRKTGYQTVFLVRPNFRSALLAKLAGIPNRVGDATEGRGFLLTHRAAISEKANQIERLQAFARAAGFEAPPEFGLPKSPLREPPTIGIAPGASYEDKMIPVPVLREIAQRLIDSGYRLALLGGPVDEQRLPDYADLDAENWIAKFSLPELIAPLSSLRAVVASDGGLYHLAVACGVPSVGAYGPTTKAHWYHAWGPHTPVLAPDNLMANVDAEMVWGALVRTLRLSEPSVNPCASPKTA